MKRYLIVIALLAALAATEISWGAPANDEATSYTRRAEVVLAFDNTGDFGPATPGTRTAGWQEALDYCVNNNRDLYVKGGYGGNKAIYHVSETIVIPPAQDFRIDGGCWVINYTGPSDKDCMVIDSAMNCEYHLGIIVYGGMKAAMRIRPDRPVPIDGFPAWIESYLFSQGIADPAPFTAGERKGGTALVFEGLKAPINNNHFYFVGGILNFASHVETIGNFAHNRLDILNLHSNAHNSVLMRLRKGAGMNVVRVSVGVDQGATGVKGMYLAGFNNTIEWLSRNNMAHGDEIILEKTAKGNRIDIIHGKSGDFDPMFHITDQSEHADNQITWSGGNIAIRSLKSEAGDFSYTQRLYPASLVLRSGTISDLCLIRSGVAVDLNASPGMPIPLDVGDQLTARSNAPFEFVVIPQKLK